MPRERWSMAVETGNAHTQLFALDSLASFVAPDRPAEAAHARRAPRVHFGRRTAAAGRSESFGVENARTDHDSGLLT